MAEMLVAQRREQLLSELKASGGLKVVDLATRLGVSRATVRRDLLDLEAEGRLSRVRGGAVVTSSHDATVMEIDDEPATAAGGAHAGPPSPERTLGLLVPSATYYYPRVVAGVQAVAAERGARAVISLSDYTQGDEAERIDDLRASGASGLLVASAAGHELPAETQGLLEATGLPFLLMERQPSDPFASCEFVVSDHRQGAFAAVGHLARLGHRAVALFTNGSPTADQVRDGHRAAVERLALAPDAPFHDSGRPTMGSAEAAEHYERFIEACLASGTRAALVHSDHDAIELMRRLRVRGLRTPDDMALIAYDDEIASLADVPLTAVAPPKQQLGEQAAQLLLDRIDAPDPADVPVRQLFLQPRLVVRSSCGAQAAHRGN
ncbi:substrate-binding domain-containing protein [Streptomyces sp. NEAU-W12]|uniref:substrate-binding domain-containing protein n=1 Tax=Streptomyces sp. NEAU-W12 TaxID=2994668 RepID=UPI00224B82A5|nr:substrate-binding domain-containing protein [Streptomyces sp. NEAU-W12]MCX2928229.1 substrate-binding domain-containing protein [Streptomyces sp. NEAU-W12]